MSSSSLNRNHLVMVSQPPVFEISSHQPEAPMEIHIKIRILLRSYINDRWKNTERTIAWLYIYISMCLLTELWPARHVFLHLNGVLRTSMFQLLCLVSGRFFKKHTDMILHKINNISVWWMQLYVARERATAATYPGSTDQRGVQNPNQLYIMTRWTILQGLNERMLLFFFLTNWGSVKHGTGSQIWQQKDWKGWEVWCWVWECL